MQNYTYKIVSVDPSQNSMVVKYTPDNIALSEYSFNITAPDNINNLEAHINTYAPQDKWSTELNPSDYLTALIGIQNSINAVSYSIDTVEFNSMSGDQSVVEGFDVIPANTVTL